MEHGDWKSMYEAACAGDLELVRYYVDSGVDVDYVHPEFMSTALVSCILAGQADTAVLLIERGADPQLVSPWDEMSPIEAATAKNLDDVVARLNHELSAGG